MPFYKKQDGQLVAGEFIDGQGYTLSAANKDEHTYPVDGWYWFTTLDSAMTGMSAVTTNSVSPRQIRQALTAAGLRTQVEAAVAASDQNTKDWWEFATAFERNHPMVSAMAAGLGISEVQIDDLFNQAATL